MAAEALVRCTSPLRLFAGVSLHRPAPVAESLLLRRLPNCWLVGLDVTHKCCMSAGAIEGMAGRGRHGTFLRDITQFYLGYHRWVPNGAKCTIVDVPTALLVSVPVLGLPNPVGRCLQHAASRVACLGALMQAHGLLAGELCCVVCCWLVCWGACSGCLAPRAGGCWPCAGRHWQPVCPQSRPFSRLATIKYGPLPCMHACRQAYKMEAVYVHDAAAFAAVVDPGLFEWQQGGVLVVTEGPAKGRTIRDEGGLL